MKDLPNWPEIAPRSGFWAPPPQAETGNAAEEDLFAAVGKALSRWEAIENGLSLLFGLFVEGNQEAATRAYGMVPSSNSRAELLRAAGEIYGHSHTDYFPAEIFDLLMKHYSDASPRRNEIAHGIVTGFRIDEVDRGFFLALSMYLSRKNAAKTLSFWHAAMAKGEEDRFFVFGHKYRYTAADIEQFATRFVDLSEWVGLLFNGLFAIEMRRQTARSSGAA